MNRTKLIFIATLINSLGFITSLSINYPGQSGLKLALSQISTLLFGLASIIGWLWIAAKVNNVDKHKPYGDKE